jgi:hypothetical protein
VRFDAQCDIACVVYGPDDDPDSLIDDFATDLQRLGARLVGVIQRGRNCKSEDPSLGVVVLPRYNIVGLTSDEVRDSGCSLDPTRLPSLAQHLALALRGGADLLIINRYGRSEAAGGGLVNLIEQAFEANIPVLIAVSKRRFPDWIRFCKGMNVCLGCRRDEVDRWWRSTQETTA